MLTNLYQKYEKQLSLAAFFTGFIVDNLTLTRIDLWLDNLILATYLGIAGFSIFFFQLLNRKKLKGKFVYRILFLLALLIQFAFGGLFSGYFVFYSKSATLVTSWLFVVLIILFLIGNEFFKKKYSRLEFQVSIFFITLFSFAIFYVPIIFDTIGASMFILSGLASLIVIWFFIKLLSLVIPRRIDHTQKVLIRSILSIYILFNVLYFTNIIPPIPLSLKDSGAYYFVERQGFEYVAQTEVLKWYEFGQRLRTTLYVSENESVYVYSAVFAPTDLSTAIYHKWEYFDEVSGVWKETDKFAYSITGGRDGGYRGYSHKSSVRPGEWRVDIITSRNQVIGRVRFAVERAGIDAPSLVSETL